MSESGRQLVRLGVTLLGAFSAAQCTGSQSALDPAGHAAEKVAGLFWWMTVGTVIVWVGVLALTWWAMHQSGRGEGERKARMLIVVAGAIVPTVVLTVLLIYGLSMMPPMLARAPEGSLRIKVVGEQWWWRVHYMPPEGGEMVLANEIRLPVNEPVEFELESADVIHSFWIPSLGGKMDMIPGRRTRLVLHPTRTGVFRGVCAEYCGASHALMALYAVVMEKEAYDQWLSAQRQPAREPVDALAIRGKDLFFSNGCSACHTIRGTAADGAVGPDLTHLASRMSLGGGILPNEEGALKRWISRTHEVKPGVLMPHFGMLPDSELAAMAAYLQTLE